MSFIFREKIKKELDKKKEIYLRVKARPGASRTAFSSVSNDPEGEIFKIDVAAPPEKGKANQELIKFLSHELGGEALIISGQSSKLKLVKIRNPKF